MMDELNALNAPKKVVDGLTEFLKDSPRCLRACLTSLNFWAQMLSRRKRIFPVVDQKAPAVSEKKVQQHRIP